MIDEARQEAERTLMLCVHEIGLKASARISGYPHVWARDSMITLLGAALSEQQQVRDAAKASIHTLIAYQTDRGLVPNNVHVDTRKANFQAYADGGLWLCVGAAAYAVITGDDELAHEVFPAVQRTLDWYGYQDVHDEGLIVTEEGADWEDLFAVRGRGLYVNVLHTLALEAAARIAEFLGEDDLVRRYLEEADEKRDTINERFWYDGSRSVWRFVRASFGSGDYDEFGLDADGNQVPHPQPVVLAEDKYYIPYFTFRQYGEWFDTFGNLLTIISGVADADRSDSLLALMRERGVDAPGPVKAIYPPIERGEKDWRDYYEFGSLNLPNQYHNGGIWPFLGGFYVAALTHRGHHEHASEQLERLAALNRKGREGEWEFNEWLHGVTGIPMGVPEQAWSAGMYVFAHECVKEGKVPFFGDLRKE